MKNLMDVYLSFTERKIKKYMKLIFNQYYDENIVNEYLRTYINARYYNIINIPASIGQMRNSCKIFVN